LQKGQLRFQWGVAQQREREWRKPEKVRNIAEVVLFQDTSSKHSREKKGKKKKQGGKKEKKKY